MVSDVVMALSNWQSDQSPINSRNLVRTTFAAVEGLSWQYKEHIIEIAREVGALSPDEEAALSEVTYQISSRGKINKQPRYIPMMTMLRLVTRIAEKLDSKLAIDFQGKGWLQLNEAIKIRNRITHPKSFSDMEIKRVDIATCIGGFEWLLDAITQGMQAANSAHRSHLTDVRQIVAKLQQGDPSVWAEYKAAKANLAD